MSEYLVMHVGCRGGSLNTATATARACMACMAVMANGWMRGLLVSGGSRIST